MGEILKKLKLSNQNPVLIINAPEEYREVIGEIQGEIHDSIQGKYTFIQAFVRGMGELAGLAKGLVESLEGDGYLWICYPKGSSKKYKTDCKRDNIIEPFAVYDFEPVTLVSINDDWSAMRIKSVDNIKTMKRKSASSEKGRSRIKEKEGF